MDTNTNSENNYKSFLKKLYPTSQLKPKSITQVIKLPRFNEKLKECEQHFSASFDSFEYALQQEIILLRLQQIVNIQQLNPLWKQRFKDFNIKEAPQNFEDWQKLPVTDKHTAIDFFSGDRKGMVVPLEHGGFEIVASGGTSSGKPSETVYSLKELEDTYAISGKFIANHVFSRFFKKEDFSPLVVTTYADFQLWSSGTMVGGVLQKIPDVNYIAAGPIDKKIYHLIMDYEGPKVFLGITESIGVLHEFGLDLKQEAKDSFRLALYCSGLLPKRKQKELKELYPNLDILSYFSASQAEAIAIQLDENKNALTAVPALHFLEIVDQKGQWVKEGEEGELVVTRLHCNEAPIIRYSLGDKALRLPIKEEDGLKAFQFEFRGRSGDVIHLDDHQFSALNMYDYLKEQLKNYYFLNLEDCAQEVQIVNNREEKLLSILIATDNILSFEYQLAAKLGVNGVQHLIKDALIASMGLYSKSSIESSTVEKTGYVFEIKFVNKESGLLYKTSVGKIPFFRDIIETKS
jgi:phenylacetate-CoA ligase